MNNIENKINLFAQAVTKDAEQQRDEIKQEIENIRKFEVDSAEAVVLEDIYHRIQAEMVATQNKYKQLISKEVFDSKRALLTKRDTIIKEVFTTVATRVLSFCATPSYLAFLVNTIKEAADSMNSTSTIVYLKKDDMHLISQIEQGVKPLTCSFEEDPSILLGGVIIRATNSNLISDETFDYRLNKAKDEFVSQSGLTLEEL